MLDASEGLRDEAYQLDLTTPGISPRSARLRKQRRHMSKRRRYARGRPQSGQRLRCRTSNFNFRFTILQVLATSRPRWIRSLKNQGCGRGSPQAAALAPLARKGMPRRRSMARASSSFVAVVTTVMFMPITFSTLS